MADSERREHDRRADVTTLGRDGQPLPPDTRARVRQGAGLALDPERYVIGEVLGEGGMGEVRRCRDRATSRDVALKAIRANVDVDHVELRFFREARVQARLSHPAVVPAYDVGYDKNGRAYFTMKRVEGVTLDEVLSFHREQDGRAREFSRHRLLSAFARVCLAVDYAHAHDVLHRDLKPANVMLGTFGEVYVLDWGLAKIVDVHDDEADTLPVDPSEPGLELPPGRTEQGIAMGTPAYMAPEQAAARPLDQRADVFSLGAILFEILSLEQLLTEEQIRRNRERRSFEFNARPSERAPGRNISPELDAICLKATAVSPTERYASARELHEAVEAFLAADEEQDRRQRLAAEHLDRARKLSGPEATDRWRPTALEELGAALALVPEDHETRRYLVHLLKNPPKEVPEEVHERRQQHEFARMRRMQRVVATIYVACWLIGYPLIVLAGGARSIPGALAVPAAWLLAALVIILLYRFRIYNRAPFPISGVVGAMALATTSFIWGPFFIVPGLAVAIAFGHILIASSRQRFSIVALVCLALAGPVYLAYIGVLDMYTPVGDAGFIIHGAVGSSRDVFFIGLTVCHLAELVFGSRFASRYRDVLDARVLENAMFSWQLANLVPRAATDSDVRRPSRASVASFESELDLDHELPTIPKRESMPPRIEMTEEHERYTRIDRLVLTDTSEVWRCHDRRLDREIEMHVALTAADDEAIRAHARLRGRLEHPAIAPLYDVGVVADTQRAYFTAKRVRGMPFDAVASILSASSTTAAPGSLAATRRRALSALGQVCLAVAYAHDRGIAHGSIANDSVVLGGFGEVHLTAWRGDPKADRNADIVALGQLLRLMLDTQAIASPELEKIVHRIPEGELPTARQISEAIDAFLSGDRDAEVRRELAQAHLERATTAAARAFGGRASFEEEGAARVEALREVGRAVRLDPEEPEAVRLLLRLITEPPARPPPAVLEEVERFRQSRARGPAIGTLLFGALWLLLYPFVVLLIGIRDLGLVIGVWVMWLIAELAVAVALVGRIPNRLPYPMLATMVAGMGTALLSGPFFITPVIATMATMSFVLIVNRSWRYPTMGLGVLMIIVPAFLSYTRILPAVDMVDDVLRTETALRAPPQATTYFVLTICNLLAVLFASQYAARFRDRLDQVETGFLVRTWQLTKLLPQNREIKQPGLTTTGSPRKN